MTKRYELTPTDSRKSFYGKCYVEVAEDGTETLYGTLKRLWFGWSATTGRHIATFCGMNKKQFEALS